MRRWLAQNYQKFTSSRARRLSKLLQQGLLDVLTQRIVWPASSGAPLAEGASAYFPNGAEIEYDSVDRQVGAVMRITAGLGFKNATEADADEVKVKPIVVKTTTALSPLVASDPTLGRIDRIFMRPLLVATNSTSVEIIDPITENVTPTNLNQDEEWRYEIAVATGVPSNPPSAGMAGVPVGWIAADEIFRVTVLAGAGSIAGPQIQDMRLLFEIADGLAPGVTTLAASAITVSPSVNGQTQVQGSLTDLDSRIVNINTSGLLVGAFERINTTSVRIRRTYRNLIAIEIGGSVITSAVDITFALPTHLDVGGEAASTFYYCYAENAGGTITPHISVTPPTVDPDAGGGQLVGYHPSHPTWRFVQAFYNDDQSNIVPFMQGPDQGEILLISRVAGTQTDFWRTVIGTGENATNWAAVALTTKLPRGIRLAHLNAIANSDSVRLMYTTEDSAGLAIATNPGLWETGAEVSGDIITVDRSNVTIDLPLSPSDATPSICWGSARDPGGSGFSIGINNIHHLGWRY